MITSNLKVYRVTKTAAVTIMVVWYNRNKIRHWWCSVAHRNLLFRRELVWRHNKWSNTIFCGRHTVLLYHKTTTLPLDILMNIIGYEYVNMPYHLAQTIPLAACQIKCHNGDVVSKSSILSVSEDSHRRPHSTNWSLVKVNASLKIHFWIHICD